MIQPTRVLPSNAPPLGDADNVHQASRVLQEHSGNRQLTEHSAAHGFEQKYTAPVLAENAWPNYAPQHATQQLYHPRPQHRSTWSCGHSRQHGYHPYEHEKILRARADHLYNLFKNAPQYNRYRQRQAKDDKADEQKWPDHVEEAFFYALVKYPPTGRQQTLHKGKLCGRNELISDVILELTGQSRKRKQVSSHIQVLRPFVESEPAILKWLTLPPQHKSGRHGSGSGYVSGRRMSTYPAAGPPRSTRASHQPAPQTDLVMLAKVKHNLEVFEPTTFSMFVQRKVVLASHETQEERLHTYTQSIEQPLGPDLPVQDWTSFGENYPCLAAMHNQKPLDCNIIVADASLGLTMDTFKDKDGVELGISFVCSSQHLRPDTRLRCHNSFYKNGSHLNDFSGAFDVQPMQLSEDRRSVTTTVKFGSTFWARTLAQLATRLRESTDKGTDHRDDVRALLGGIVAVQEVVAVSQHGAERLLIMFWTFRQSSAVTGRTSWRRLILPPIEESTTLSPDPDAVKPERADSMYDYGMQFAEMPPSQAQSEPTLQSPFEYESSSGSALSSVTWPTAMNDGSGLAQSFATDNDFDFHSGNINMAFDPSLDFSNFDSHALDLGASNPTEFAADPALEQYSQPWCGDAAINCDRPTPLSAISADTSSASQLDGQMHSFGGFSAQYDPQMYGASGGEQQAYGGAGQDWMQNGDDALAALADASYMAQTMAERQAST